jgi:hypothetical protein
MVISSFLVGALEPGAGSHEIMGFAGTSRGSDGASGLSDFGGVSDFVSDVLSEAFCLSSPDDVPAPVVDVSEDESDVESDVESGSFAGGAPAHPRPKTKSEQSTKDAALTMMRIFTARAGSIPG